MDILNVDDVLYRQRDLDAVAVVVGSEDDALYRLDPFLCTRRAIRPEVVCAVVSRHGEVKTLLVLVRNVDGYGVPQVDLAVGEVDVGGVRVVGEDVALETEPVPVVLGVPPTAFREITGFGDLVLRKSQTGREDQ